MQQRDARPATADLVVQPACHGLGLGRTMRPILNNIGEVSDMTNQNGLLLFMTDIDAAHEAEFHRWYEEEHLTERMAIPGFITARRFQAIEGGPKYLALYDLETPDVLQSAAYRHIVGAGKSDLDQTHGIALHQWPPQRLCRHFRAASLSSGNFVVDRPHIGFLARQR